MKFLILRLTIKEHGVKKVIFFLSIISLKFM